MRLRDLLARLPGAELHGDPALEIADVTHDSRRSSPGSLFVAIRGLVTDGNQFVDAARKKGAVAVCSEAPPSGEGAWVRVADAREALATLVRRDPRRPRPRARPRGRHRHERQDDDDLPRGLRPARRRREGGPRRHGRVPRGRPRRRGGAHDARVVRPPGPLPRDGGRRLPARGARGVLALARPEARPRPRVPRSPSSPTSPGTTSTTTATWTRTSRPSACSSRGSSARTGTPS